MKNVTAVLITTKDEYPKEISIDGFGEVLIKTNSPSVFERYLLAEKATNDIIYVQDDDCIVDYKALWRYYDGRLTNTMTPHHYSAYSSTGATLVGWGCFFPKAMLKEFHRYIDRYGQDFHLFREADRIFTVLNQPHNTIIAPHQDLPQVGRMSHEALHYEWAREAIEKTRVLL
jgi:hypothetical protein